MATFSIKLVDHTLHSSDTWRAGITKKIQELFDVCLSGTGDSAFVQWGTSSQSDNLVLHFVFDVDNSYVQQKLPGAALGETIGGHTRTQKGETGSEIYKFSGPKGNRTSSKYVGYAKLAMHEFMHNLFPGWSEGDMHGKAGGGGFAASPPQLPPTEKNKELLRRGLAVKNKQLL
jgi:hypothetical protein